MSYLFIKNLFQREKFVLLRKKKCKILKNPKKQKKNIFSGFLGGFFWWVFYCQPCDLGLMHKVVRPQEREDEAALREILDVGPLSVEAGRVGRTAPPGGGPQLAEDAVHGCEHPGRVGQMAVQAALVQNEPLVLRHIVRGDGERARRLGP